MDWRRLVFLFSGSGFSPTDLLIDTPFHGAVVRISSHITLYACDLLQHRTNLSVPSEIILLATPGLSTGLNSFLVLFPSCHAKLDLTTGTIPACNLRTGTIRAIFISPHIIINNNVGLYRSATFNLNLNLNFHSIFRFLLSGIGKDRDRAE